MEDRLLDKITPVCVLGLRESYQNGTFASSGFLAGSHDKETAALTKASASRPTDKGNVPPVESGRCHVLVSRMRTMTVTGRRESFAQLRGDWRQGQAGRQVWENRRDSHGGVSF